MNQKRPSIIFLGASTISSFGLAEEDSFVAQLQSLYDESGAAYQVINAGAPGASSESGVEQLTPYLDSKHDLAAVVITLGLSDAVYRIDPGSIKYNLKSVIKLTRGYDPNVKIFLCKARFFQEAVMRPLPIEYETPYLRLFPDLATEEGIPLLPFILRDVAGQVHLNQDDRLHPTAEGMKIVAQNVYESLAEYLSTGKG